MKSSRLCVREELIFSCVAQVEARPPRWSCPGRRIIPGLAIDLRPCRLSKWLAGFPPGRSSRPESPKSTVSPPKMKGPQIGVIESGVCPGVTMRRTGSALDGSCVVREIRTSAGAGLIVAICGDIMTVPGLPTRPGFFDIDFDFDRDRIVGIF